MTWNGHLPEHELQEYVAKVLGSGYAAADVVRMQGGAQKVVYKIECTNGFACMLYVWDLNHNYFQEEISQEETEERSFGGLSFQINHRFMRESGVLTPALYDLNVERSRYPFDYALVEYIHGPKAEAYMGHSDPLAQKRVFGRLGEMIANMHAHERAFHGRPDSGEKNLEPCHLLLLKEAKEELSFLSQQVESIQKQHDHILTVLDQLGASIDARRLYGYIHGELGPDHVIVTQEQKPYLIDIEGARFFDIEYEHVFLELRFGDRYRDLAGDRLDWNRMQFYRLYHYISLTGGGLKLLHRGFPDQAFASRLAAYHTGNILRFVQEWG
ncbi:aminoglycoside phosphotransferase family protein [Peribacillus sp. NPDC056705]|uniref:aminoglycoside phosphotransferase family protein n=1 Tax=Peribacillus sp. NPDC056705 TaxID=3345918 RepID=UPI003749D8AF